MNLIYEFMFMKSKSWIHIQHHEFIYTYEYIGYMNSYMK